MRYESIKSEFIKEKIKGLPWDKRGYIDDLARLEGFILHDGGCYASAMAFKFLKEQYKSEFHQIYRELNPKEFSNYLKIEKERENKLKKEEKERKARKGAMEEILKKEWHALGGRVG